MKPTQALHEAGQSLWLDNITRALLDEGILARYVDEYSVTGLTSNPTIFDKAIRDGTAYDADIAARKASGASDEEVFFELALADLRRAAGDRSIPAARVQARRSVIFAGAPAVDGPPPTFQGAIFDVDGVLVDSPHFRAWREALQELMDTEWAELRGQTSYSPQKFTEALYQQVIAGRAA